MYITITYIKLRSPWKFFTLTYNAMHIVKQCKGEKGFKGMKNTGFGLHHYTMSKWETEEDRQRFYRAGAHAEAMKKTAELATELRSLTYEGNDFPDWKTAKGRIMQEGKVLSFKG